MEPLKTTEEIADVLRVEVVTVRRLAARGELPAYRIGSEFRFIEQEIEDYVKSQRVDRDGATLANRLGKFTERARKVMSLANQEAGELEHAYVGTEHLLLGLLREGEGIAALLLKRQGLTYPDVREQVLQRLDEQKEATGEFRQKPLAALFRGTRGDKPVAGERELTGRVKQVITLSLEEARELNHTYIGTEHLLLGILRQSGGLAAKILLEQYHLELEAARAQVLEILQENAPAALPEIPNQATTLLGENEQGQTCSRCGARNPAFFRFCFHCGLKFA